MRILVLYYMPDYNDRKTIDDHLFSFKRYDTENQYYYFNLVGKMPQYISKISFDVIILHYTMLSIRWCGYPWRNIYPSVVECLSKMPIEKIAFPQDEYAHTKELCDLFFNAKIKTVFTLAYPNEYSKFFPIEKSGVENIYTTYTGFVDSNTLAFIKENHLDNMENRSIDIGYRARNLPYWLGSHGQLKIRLGNHFKNYLKNDAEIKADISNDEKDVFYGNDWIRFLASCRVVLGCLGGASLLDFDGKLRDAVEDYLLVHPDASFEEVEQQVFKNRDGEIQLFALSPRHFECAMTKTCQVLVEGDYNGVLRPGIDFIELKRDFSNMKEVVALIKDAEYCKKIANNCYEKVVASENYTYKAFVESVLKVMHTISNQSPQKDTAKEKFLLFRMKFDNYFMFKKYYTIIKIKKVIKKIVKWEKLYVWYRRYYKSQRI